MTILYIENLKSSAKIQLELINKFSKVAGYNINIQKMIVFLYSSNVQTENQIRKTIPFIIASKFLNT